MQRNFIFRAWFYVREGWFKYFTFVIGAVNTLVITYYLAIERAPFLKEVFPAFGHYALVFILIGFPLIVTIGFFHYKKMPAFKSDTEVTMVSNPFMYKLPPGWTKEITIPFYLATTKIMVKLSKNEKLTNEEIAEITSLQKKMDHLLQGGYVGDYKKLPFGTD